MENKRQLLQKVDVDKAVMPVRGPSGRTGGPGRMPIEKVKVKDGKGTILRLWNYLSSQRILLIVALFFVFSSSILSLVASYIIRPIMNGIADKVSSEILIKQLFIMLFLFAISVICNYLQSRLMVEISQKALSKLRRDLFCHMQNLPLKYFDKASTGDIMSRFTNDIDAINQMLSTTLVQVVSSVVSLVVTGTLMFYTNWFLAIITFTIAPIVKMVTGIISKRTLIYFKQQQKAIGELNGYIEEQITGQKVIKVFSHERKSIENFKRFNKNYKNKAFKAQFWSGTMGPIMGGFNHGAYALTASIGGVLCVLRGFDVGGFTIFLNYSRSFTRPITDLFTQVNMIFSALAGAERVFEMMDIETEYKSVLGEDKESKSEEKVEKESRKEWDIEGNRSEEKVEEEYKHRIEGEIIFNHITFGYDEKTPVLKEVSIEVRKGEMVALVGATGAGKTTITNLLNRFYDIQSGSILIDGYDIKKYDKTYLREHIAMVLQDTHLFTGSVMENIRYGRLEATDEEVREAARVANADRFIRQLEQGYETVLSRDGLNISQGQRQLLNIARAIISKAPILVLDEATSSVDTKTERQIEQAMRRLMKDRTTFIVAHRLSTVRNADKILVLEKGEVIEQGNHKELLDLKGKYASLYHGKIILDCE